MKSRIVVRSFIGAWLIQLAFVSAAAAQSDNSNIIGRWDVIVHDADSTYPSWFEVRLSGHRTLVGSYVGQFGSARPIASVEWNGGVMRFVVPPQWEDRKTDVVYEGQLEGDVIRGHTTNNEGDRISWEARRAPSLDRESSAWGKPIELFNRHDLQGWKPRSDERKNGWQVRDGVLVNAEPGNDLMTEQLFTDFKLQAEFRYPQGSNSGIYLRGRYEVQIEDNFGDEPNNERIGGVYGFLTPCVNAAKPAGEWQTIEVTLIGRRVTVVFNCERVIDRQKIPGITGGALNSDEGQPGPILIQGDHGPVEFRALRLTPAVDSQN
jgi:hypothetical protein